MPSRPARDLTGSRWVAAHPWETGGHDADWAGYFLRGTDVLRNRVGVTTPADLADAGNDLVEIRVA